MFTGSPQFEYPVHKFPKKKENTFGYIYRQTNLDDIPTIDSQHMGSSTNLFLSRFVCGYLFEMVLYDIQVDVITYVQCGYIDTNKQHFKLVQSQQIQLSA